MVPLSICLYNSIIVRHRYQRSWRPKPASVLNISQSMVHYPGCQLPSCVFVAFCSPRTNTGGFSDGDSQITLQPLSTTWQTMLQAHQHELLWGTVSVKKVLESLCDYGISEVVVEPSDLPSYPSHCVITIPSLGGARIVFDGASTKIFAPGATRIVGEHTRQLLRTIITNILHHT